MISAGNVIEYIGLLRRGAFSTRLMCSKEQRDTIISQVTLTRRIKHY